MEDKIAALTRSIEELKKQMQGLQTKIDTQARTVDQLARDIGISDSKILSDVIYKMDGYMTRDVADAQTVVREVQDTRRMVTNVELMMKELMKGLSVIYNTVDELEENLLPERLTK